MRFFGQTVRSIKNLRARYVLHFSILHTGTHFRSKIPTYLSKRIFFSLSKMQFEFLKKVLIFLKILKILEKLLKNTFSPAFDGEVGFQKF